MTSSKLSAIRSQLASLQRRRQFVRWGTGLTALVTAVLLALLGVFLLDWMFQRSIDVAQRVILELLAAGAIVWAFQKFTQPWLAVREDELEMALLVERQQHIDSDLVAALQFERPEAAAWGSTQLETAVIDRVAEMGRGLNVFEGLRPDQLRRRLLACGAAIAFVAVLCFAFPGHARAFLDRLCLGTMHYPSRTVIERLVVNDRPVFERVDDHYLPQAAKSAEARAVSFAVRCSGELPEEATVQVAGENGQRRDAVLHKLTREERLARLDAATAKIQAARSHQAKPGEFREDEVAALAQLDAPRAAAALVAEDKAADLELAAKEIGQAKESLTPEKSSGSAIYLGELPRLYSSVQYKTLAGDAWTDRAAIKQIDLPQVRTELVPSPPEYARSAKLDRADQGERALTVVEGTSVAVRVVCSNKALAKAWISITTEKDPVGQPRQLTMLPKKDGREWELNDPKSPLASVHEGAAYEIQVVDEDGLRLPEPLRGRIAYRPDRAPVVTLATDNRVKSGNTEVAWLTDAKPRLKFTVRDDYAVDRVVLKIKVFRHETQLWEEEREVRAKGKPLTGDKLPWIGTTTVDLAGLQAPSAQAENGVKKGEKLAAGDRVEVVLEAFDYRGGAQPESGLSDVVELPIGKDGNANDVVINGIKSAEQKATDSIKTQQSDSGGSP